MMKTHKLYWLGIISIILLGIVFFMGCASSAKVAPIHTPQFVSPISKQEQVTPSEISIALVNPVITTQSSTTQSSTTTGFDDNWAKMFRSSLAKDLEQLIIAKGFKIVGPFASVDEMTYPQKKQSDLGLFAVIGLGIAAPQAEVKEKINWGGALVGGSSTKYDTVWTGSCTAQGFVNFELWELLSQQKMWTKKVEIAPIQRDCTAKGSASFLVVFNNAYSQLLEEVYKAALIKANAYFEREEVELVVKQSQEIREKKVY